MAKHKTKSKASIQEMQDGIFRKMSADKKVKLGSDFWKLAKSLVGKKIDYGANRSKTASGGNL